ncbi:hypothetical protein RHSIM_Rhsim08G0194800 [Rhododendron simsii]|uniref:CASP-like protein n=1 Tax=Rhododendron simsii TaxID=118357 RepID=A0A834LHQ3_RHOSS|nr:hypothetical protein RHSIM_Rhsim08G0194800 [Rhododendron simsii]
MAGVEAKIMQNPPPKTSPKSPLGAQICLRLLGAAASLSAALVTVTSKQTVCLYGAVIDAQYTYSSAFTFFAIANLVACAFSVVSLFAAGILARKCKGPNKYFFMFLHDLAVTTLLMAACAAATAIGLVAKFGNSHIGWMAICNDFGRFCDRIIVALTLSYLAFLVHLLLTVISANGSRGIHV